MGKYLKYFLEILLLLIVLSCTTKKEKLLTDVAKSSFYYEKVMENHFRQGSPIEQMYLDSSIYYNPNNADAYFEKSAWQIKIGNYYKYFQLMDKAVELKPEVYLGHRGVIKLYYLRDYIGAISDLKSYRLLFPNTEEIATRGENTNHLLGMAYMGLEDFKTAISFFNKCIANAEKQDQLDYVDIYTFVNKAICHIELKEYDQAQFELQRVLKQYNKCSEAHFYLAKIFSVTGEKLKACESINLAKFNFLQGYYQNDSYREVQNQLYLKDIEDFENVNCL